VIMAKCTECGNSFGFFELSGNRCKSCIEKLYPKCDTCYQVFSASEMVGGSCESCHEKNEKKSKAAQLKAEKEIKQKKIKDQYLQSSVESLHGTLVKTVFVASEKSLVPGIFSEKPGDTVNGELLACSIEEACNQLVSEGYMIVNIMPVTSGHMQHYPDSGAGYGYTSGVIITASSVKS